VHGLRFVLELAACALVLGPADRWLAGPPGQGHDRGGARTLYLTFDADMTPGMLKRLRAGEVALFYDPGIIAFLHENHVPATIFVTGLFAETYPGFVAALARDPLFAIGNHGYLHAAFTAHCYGLPVLRTDQEKAADLAHAQTVLSGVAGYPPTRFRYPGLCRGPGDDELVRRAGLTVDVPTVVAGDAFAHNARAIVRSVLRQARDGGVVLFHLGGPNAPVTLDALRALVPALTSRGFTFRQR
jgi:peptidoglycan/xylan/chitin deacetylase (PgdA/CDA1 family)